MTLQVLDPCEKCIFLCQCFNEEAADNETSCKQIFGFFSFALLVVIQSLCFVDICSTSCNTFRQTNLLLALFQNFKNSEQATSSMVKRQHIVTKKIKPVKLSERLQGNLASTIFREDNKRHCYHHDDSILHFDLRCFQFHQNLI